MKAEIFFRKIILSGKHYTTGVSPARHIIYTTALDKVAQGRCQSSAARGFQMRATAVQDRDNVPRKL